MSSEQEPTEQTPAPEKEEGAEESPDKKEVEAEENGGGDGEAKGDGAEEEGGDKVGEDKEDAKDEDAKEDEPEEGDKEDSKDKEEEGSGEEDKEEVVEETVEESKVGELTEDDKVANSKEGVEETEAKEEEGSKEDGESKNEEEKEESEDPLCPERLKAVFEVFQKDDSVEVSEIGSMIRSLGFNPLDEEVEEILKGLNEESVSSLDFEKFKSLVEAEVEKRKGIDEDQRFKDAFDIFDKEKTGKISKGELKEVLTSMGNMKLTEEEADDVIEKLEFDEEEHISHEDIIKLLRS